MTYDDSEKALARGAVASFMCLLCGRPMRDAGKRWKCRCGFFYKPLIPGTIPKKYQHGAVSAKKLCRDCRRSEVRRNQIYCVACAGKRQRLAKREAARKRRSNVDKVAFSPIGAEALTKPDLADSYGSSGHPIEGKLSMGTTGPVV
jgi:hypothetical protein